MKRLDPKVVDELGRCGSDTLGATSEIDPFFSACNEHDEDYLKGGDVDDLNYANGRFYHRLFKQARKKPWLYPRALLYSGLVSIVGRFMFKREPRGKFEKKD